MLNTYRMEDKGSCIVRIKADDYEKNAKDNLMKGNQYEKLNSDPTNQTVEKVNELVDKLKENEHIKETTADVIKAKTNDCKPGAYTEQPKTHKFKEETHDLSNGFPARGVTPRLCKFHSEFWHEKVAQFFKRYKTCFTKAAS